MPKIQRRGLKRKWEELMFPKKKVKVPGVNSKQIALAVRRQIAQVAEKKELTTANNPSTVPAVNGTVVPLNVIAEGTDINERVGRHITMQSIDTCIQIYGPTDTDNVYQDMIYVAMVYDTQPNNTPPTYGTIMDAAGSTYSNLLPNTKSYGDRFRILWEERSVVQNQSNGAAGTLGMGGQFENIYYRKYYKLPLLKTEYNDATADTPNTGGLYLIFASQNNTGNTLSSGAVGYTCKLKFTDM